MKNPSVIQTRFLLRFQWPRTGPELKLFSVKTLELDRVFPEFLKSLSEPVGTLRAHMSLLHHCGSGDRLGRWFLFFKKRDWRCVLMIGGLDGSYREGSLSTTSSAKSLSGC